MITADGIQATTAARFVPYQAQIDRYSVALENGDLLRVFRLQGRTWQSREEADLQAWQGQLNGLLRNIASPHVALWTHVLRRPAALADLGPVPEGVAGAIDARYRERLQMRGLLANELYLSVVYRPDPMLQALPLWRPASGSQRDLVAKRTELRSRFDELTAVIGASLEPYQPRLLGCHDHKGIACSATLEFLAALINGEHIRTALPRARLGVALPRARLFFGNSGRMSIRLPAHDEFAAVLGVQEYPAQTWPGCLNGLLALPFELVLTQSFAFVPKDVAIRRMTRQHVHLEATEDLAASQADALTETLDSLASNEVVIGTHHLSLQVRAQTLALLDRHVSLAGAALSDCGLKWVREDLALPSAFWAQLPGNFRYRVNCGDITSLNFAGLSPLHNHACGSPTGNQWGPAVTTLISDADEPYYFSFHPKKAAADDKDAAERRENASTLIIGATGSGKTVLAMHLLCQLQRFRQPGSPPIMPVVLDVLQGCAVTVQALGKYFRLRAGEPTGWNPFQLQPGPRQIEFLQRIVRVLVRRPGRPLSVAEERRLDHAIEGVLAAPAPMRRPAALLQFLDAADPDGLHARMLPWCGAGRLAWLFDNERDELALDAHAAVGFDLTDVLKLDEARTAATMYLLQRVADLQETHRVPLFMDEFPQYMSDPEFADLAGSRLVTIRKLDGFLVLLAQYPRQVLDSAVASGIVSQTRTKIFFPDPYADRDDYVDGFKLTQREFEIIRSLPERSRSFLIKQGEDSVVAQLDLNGMDRELRILSSNPAAAQRMDMLRARHGDDPALWLPHYLNVDGGLT